MLLKILLLALFFAVTVIVGVVWRKSSSKSVDGFVLGGRKAGPWLSAFAYGTSYFSAVIFIGYAGQFGWKYGVSATWIGIGNAIIGSMIPWLLLGRRTRSMTQSLGSATMPDYFGKRFDSKSLRVVASLIVFIFLIPYTASLYNGLSRLFEMAFGIDYIWCVVGMAVLTGIYVVLGGYMATAINSFIQGIIMLIGIVAVVIAVLNANGGLTAAVQKLAEVPVENGPAGSFASLFGPQPLYLLGVVLLTSLGTWGLPQMVGKFYAIKDENAIKRGTTISTIFAIIVAGGCYFLGGFGRLYGDVIERVPAGAPNAGAPIFDSIVPKMLSTIPSDLIIAIVVVLVFSASMSTLSSLVLTSSSTLTLDMIMPATKKTDVKTREKKQLLSIRILLVFFIVVSAAIAIVQAKSSVTFIAQLMGISWGALAGAFLAPFLYSMYSKKISKAAVWVSFICGVGIMVAQMACTASGITFENPVLNYFNNPINAGVLAMVAGLILVPVVSAFTKSKTTDDVNKAFDRYKKYKLTR
ncbi:MAG: sodium:solute symporter [Clostridia bacterium]|nr:sodium:solute symporter [Clostridia bacterium]